MDIRENAYFHTLLRLLRARPASSLPCSPLREGGGGRHHLTGGRLCCIERVAVDTSGQGPRVLTVLDEHRAVHDGVGNALRPLADTPTIVGEVVHHVFR